MEKESCLNVNLEHKYEFEIAAHGATIFRCVMCGDAIDVYEDSQP